MSSCRLYLSEVDLVVELPLLVPVVNSILLHIFCCHTHLCNTTAFNSGVRRTHTQNHSTIQKWVRGTITKYMLPTVGYNDYTNPNNLFRCTAVIKTIKSRYWSMHFWCFCLKHNVYSRPLTCLCIDKAEAGYHIDGETGNPGRNQRQPPTVSTLADKTANCFNSQRLQRQLFQLSPTPPSIFQLLATTPQTVSTLSVHGSMTGTTCFNLQLLRSPKGHQKFSKVVLSNFPLLWALHWEQYQQAQSLWKLWCLIRALGMRIE